MHLILRLVALALDSRARRRVRRGLERLERLVSLLGLLSAAISRSDVVFPVARWPARASNRSSSLERRRPSHAPIIFRLAPPAWDPTVEPLRRRGSRHRSCDGGTRE